MSIQVRGARKYMRLRVIDQAEAAHDGVTYYEVTLADAGNPGQGRPEDNDELVLSTRWRGVYREFRLGEVYELAFERMQSGRPQPPHAPPSTER